MFYLNSLKEQISKSNLQLNQYKPTQKKYIDKTRNIKGKLLFITKFNVKYTDIYSHKMSSIDDNDKSYTLKELHDTWKEKSNVDFDLNHQKFLKDIMPQKVIEAKESIKKLVNPDKFNIYLPRWNSTSKLNDDYPKSIKQSVFNITHGLTTWEGTELKDSNIEEGIDSRNKTTQWNNSTLIIGKEKEELNHQSVQDAKNNTHNYWYNNTIERRTHSQLPISPNRKSYEKARYYQEYKSPKKRIKTNLEIMRKVKNNLRFEKEAIKKEVIKENPGCKHIREKIDALVEKRMQSKYMKQFNIAIGKRNENQYYQNQSDKWKDNQLIEKINTVTNWKDIDWFKPNRTMKSSTEQKDSLRKNLLKPLVIYRKEMTKEQDNIEISRMNQYKKRTKKEKIKKRNVSEDKWTKHFNMSKYPIDLSFYEKISNGEYNIRPEIAQDIDQKEKDFFDAYKTITINKIKEKQKRRKEFKRNNSCFDYYSCHPGKYVCDYILTI